MKYLVDTDWVINFLKGHKETVDVLNPFILKQLELDAQRQSNRLEMIIQGENNRFFTKYG